MQAGEAFRENVDETNAELKAHLAIARLRMTDPKELPSSIELFFEALPRIFFAFVLLIRVRASRPTLPRAIHFQGPCSKSTSIFEEANGMVIAAALLQLSRE